MNYETLLSHSDFVRAIARQLIFDENTQDDVVQDTWLAAIKHKDKKIKSLPAWLATVARNFARMKLRGEGRRLQRERSVAQGERLASTEEVVQKEAMRRQVVDTVLGLKEPYRSAVLYRYYEELTPKEIAQRLNIPASTVRSHVSRGLEQMRQKLDREYGNDRQAWRTALAPLAGIKAASGLFGGLGLIAAAVLLLGGALYFSVLSDSKENQPFEETWFFDDPTEEETVYQAPPQEIERLPASKPKSREGILLRGRVVREETGAAVPGVRLQAQIFNDKKEHRDHHDAVTDKEGGFSFSIPSPGLLESISIFAGPNTIRAASSQKKWLTPGEHELKLKVSGGGSVRGVVMDANDQPVPGAVVKGWCCWSHQSQAWSYGEELKEPHRVTTADSAGRFILEHLGGSFLITAEAPGLVCRWRLYGKMKTGQEVKDVTLIMGQAQTLRGRVTGKDGRPLEGVKVLAKTPMNKGQHTATQYQDIHRAYPLTEETFTDQNGEFSLSPLAPCLDAKKSRPYIITVKHAPYLLWRSQPTDFNEVLDIALKPGATLSGVIYDSKGDVIQNALVRARDYSNRPSVRTNKQGAFSVQGLVPAESGQVSVSAEGMAVRFEKVGPLLDGETCHVKIVMDPELVLSGTVCDGNGLPAPDTLVTIRGDRHYYSYGVSSGTWESQVGLDETRTDEQGGFFFDRLYDGEFTVSVSSKTNPYSTIEVKTRSGVKELKITLDEQATRKVVLWGSVTDSHTGRPIQRFNIIPMREIPRKDGMKSWSGSPQPFDSSDGAYEITGLSEGEIGISVTAEGYVGKSLPVKAYAIGNHQLDFSLAPARSVKIRVLDEKGEPMKGATVQATQGESLDSPEKNYAAQRTDEKGETVLHQLPGAKVVFWVFRPNGCEGSPFPMDLYYNFEGTKDLVLSSDVETMNVGMAIMGANEKIESGVINQQDMEQAKKFMPLMKSGDIWIMDVSFIVTVYGDSGAVIEKAVCKRISSEKWAMSVGKQGSYETNRPGVRFRLPKKAVRFKVEAPGYEDLEIPFEPKCESSSIMAILIKKN